MEFAGGGVDDADVEVVDEQDDASCGVGAADADVVHADGASEGDGAGLVDAVVADPVVGDVAGGFGPGVGQQVVDDGRSAAAAQSLIAPATAEPCLVRSPQVTVSTVDESTS